jgi:orotate phosphoribosyltransferase
MQRILYKPVFYGDIQAGKAYVLIDDVVTQGGTIGALWQFVVSSGGSVSAIVALAYGKGSKNIRPTAEYAQQLYTMFGRTLQKFLEEHEMAFGLECLTNSQIKYLLKYSRIENIKKKAEDAIASMEALQRHCGNAAFSYQAAPPHTYLVRREGQISV